MLSSVLAVICYLGWDIWLELFYACKTKLASDCENIFIEKLQQYLLLQVSAPRFPFSSAITNFSEFWCVQLEFKDRKDFKNKISYYIVHLSKFILITDMIWNIQLT